MTGLSRSNYINTFTNQKDIIDAYHAGLLDKDESVLAENALANKAPLDFYGKIVDQHGQPVPDVKVQGYVSLGFGDSARHDSQSDAKGYFSFMGLHGQGLGIRLFKEGYEYGYKIPYQRPNTYSPNPNDPTVITLWKLRGPEPMIHKKCESRVPYDGTPATFNLVKGKKDSNGDLKISLVRSLMKVHRGRDKYDWTVKIEMTGGGLLPENDRYPYWAPETGYQSFFETSLSSNAVPWSGQLIQNFYFKDKQNQYGRLLIDLSTDSMRPETGITIETWLNPSGSQNLEFDRKKQVRR